MMTDDRVRERLASDRENAAFEAFMAQRFPYCRVNDRRNPNDGGSPLEVNAMWLRGFFLQAREYKGKA